MFQQAPPLVEGKPAPTVGQLHARAEPRCGSLRVAIRLTITVVAFLAVPLLADSAERSSGIAFLCIMGSGLVLASVWSLTGGVASDGYRALGPFTVPRRGLLVVSWGVAALVPIAIVCWVLGLGALSSSYLLALLSALAAVLTGAVELVVRACSWIRLRWRQVHDRAGFVSVRSRRLFVWRCVELESGLGLFVVLALSFATIFVGADQVSGVTELGSDASVVEPGSPIVPLDDASDYDILVGLEPVLSYGAGDASPPVEVDAYFAESAVSQIAPIASGSVDGGLTSPPTCVDLQRACVLVDNRRCPNSPACRPLTYDGEFPEVAVDEQVVAYGRVFRRGRDSLPDWDTSPFGDDLIGIAQWWYFTPLDNWTDGFLTRLGQAHKVHPADWEQITIGFGADRPLFVAFSSHCGGRWRVWHDVRVLNRGYEPADVLGTLLHVRAERTDGSHGFYFDQYESQSPDLGGCIAPFWRRVIRGHLMVAGLSDATGGAGHLVPRLITGEAANSVLEYPAIWSIGTTTTVDIVGVRFVDVTDGSVSDPHGPGAPALKSVYLAPIRTIFCSRTWTDDASGGDLEPSC